MFGAVAGRGMGLAGFHVLGICLTLIVSSMGGCFYYQRCLYSHQPQLELSLDAFGRVWIATSLSLSLSLSPVACELTTQLGDGVYKHPIEGLKPTLLL
jgi:hypothetical protein